MDDKTWAEITARFAKDEEPPPGEGSALPAVREKMRPRGAPFAKGVSGNPGGRPKGARNKAVQLAQVLLDRRTRKLTNRAVEMALEGNALAMKLCIERILPRQRETAIELDLPRLTTAAECSGAMATVIEAASGGDLTLRDARRLFLLIQGRVRGMEYEEFENRLSSIERTIEERRSAAPTDSWR